MFSKCVLAAAATIWFAMLGADHRVMAHDAALDSEIFTTWKFGHDGTSLSYLVCGSTKKTEGCYAKGNLSPFENVCAILDGRATRLDRVLTRDMYVLDRRTSAEQPVLLDVYTRTDTFEQGVDRVEFTLKQQIALDLPGGKAHCAIAAGDTDLFVGTGASQNVLRIDKSDFSIAEFGQIRPVTSITADDRGFVAVQAGGFEVFAPDGQSLEDGGGPGSLINTRTGLTSK